MLSLLGWLYRHILFSLVGIVVEIRNSTISRLCYCQPVKITEVQCPWRTVAHEFFSANNWVILLDLTGQKSLSVAYDQPLFEECIIRIIQVYTDIFIPLWKVAPRCMGMAVGNNDGLYHFFGMEIHATYIWIKSQIEATCNILRDKWLCSVVLDAVNKHKRWNKFVDNPSTIDM